MRAQEPITSYLALRFFLRSKVSRVQPAVVMPLDADEEEVTFSTVPDTAPPQPYLQYGPDDLGGGGGGDKGLGSGAGDGAGGGKLPP